MTSRYSSSSRASERLINRISRHLLELGRHVGVDGYVGKVIEIAPEGGKVKLGFCGRTTGWFDVDYVQPGISESPRTEPIPSYPDPYPDAALYGGVVGCDDCVLGRVLRIGPGGEMVEVGLPTAETPIQREARLNRKASPPNHPHRGWFYAEGLRRMSSREVAEWEEATQQRV